MRERKRERQTETDRQRSKERMKGGDTLDKKSKVRMRRDIVIM